MEGSPEMERWSTECWRTQDNSHWFVGLDGNPPPIGRRSLCGSAAYGGGGEPQRTVPAEGPCQECADLWYWYFDRGHADAAAIRERAQQEGVRITT